MNFYKIVCGEIKMWKQQSIHIMKFFKNCFDIDLDILTTLKLYQQSLVRIDMVVSLDNLDVLLVFKPFLKCFLTMATIIVDYEHDLGCDRTFSMMFKVLPQ